VNQQRKKALKPYNLINHGRPHYVEVESRYPLDLGGFRCYRQRLPADCEQDQPLLRLPYELLRKNFKGVQLAVERDSTAVRNNLKETAVASQTHSCSPDEVLKNLDSMISKMRGLKRKLTASAEEEKRLLDHTQSRIKHIGDLYSMQSLDDVKYEAWSRTRLDRLVVDYLLRTGYKESAVELAREKGIDKLVDVETFVQMNKIRESLAAGRVTEALAWCNENKKELRRIGVCASHSAYMDLPLICKQSKLEFTLRFQQYIELLRIRDHKKNLEAIAHAKKYLVPFRESYPEEFMQISGLLAFPPGRAPPAYEALYSQDRWKDIAELFMLTHNNLLSLPSVPLLHIALSAGLSALKTPSCHSSHVSSSGSPASTSSMSSSVCPICSTELNDLARNVPYALHTKSHVDPDAVLLPNGRVYGKSKLEEYSRKAGLPDGEFKDLRTGEVFSADLIKKVYIS
jgi:macrophage erythroblast attacher